MPQAKRNTTRVTRYAEEASYLRERRHYFYRKTRVNVWKLRKRIFGK